MTAPMYRSQQRGFTLLELMVVVTVMGVLAMMAVYSSGNQRKKALRTEVTVALDKIREAQSLHYIEHGSYASSFDTLMFQVDQGQQVSETVYSGKIYDYSLSNPWGPHSFYVSAVGNLDNDDFLDMWVLEAGRP